MDTVQPDVNEMLITLTSDIVAAHISNNNVAVDEVPTLISNVFGALSSLGQKPAEPEAAPLKPAVSLRSSVKADKIVCLDCGAELQMLKRHLMTHHNMTPEEYKARWNLPADYPLVAPNYTDKRRDLAKQIGLGRKPGEKRARKAKG